MIKFDKPNLLNGSQLCRELVAAGVKIDNPLDTCSIDEYGNFWLKIDEKDEAKAKPIVAAHIGIDETEAKAQAKAAVLAQLGITEEQAKLLLS